MVILDHFSVIPRFSNTISRAPTGELGGLTVLCETKCEETERNKKICTFRNEKNVLHENELSLTSFAKPWIYRKRNAEQLDLHSAKYRFLISQSTGFLFRKEQIFHWILLKQLFAKYSYPSIEQRAKHWKSSQTRVVFGAIFFSIYMVNNRTIIHLGVVESSGYLHSRFSARQISTQWIKNVKKC